jgi:hypothetical protein
LQVIQSAVAGDGHQAEVLACADGSHQIVGHCEIAAARPTRGDDQSVFVELRTQRQLLGARKPLRRLPALSKRGFTLREQQQ